MHPSGAFRVQPHFVRSLARSASLPGCGCPFGTSKIKNHKCVPEGSLTRHDHGTCTRVRATITAMTPSPTLPHPPASNFDQKTCKHEENVRLCVPESAHMKPMTPPPTPSPNPKLSRINFKLQLYRLWFNPTWKQGVYICAQRGVCMCL